MFIYGTLLFGEFRLAFAFGGIALLMMFDLLSVERFTQSASLDVIIFLIGTFLVIGYLEESRFFEFIVEAIVRAVGPRPQTLLLALMTIASVASALVGEVTAVLFMAGAMLHLTGKYRLNPVPFIIMLVFACNNGSAMSSVGNPIGVLISLKTGLGFGDFLCYAAPTAIVVERRHVPDLPVVLRRRVSRLRRRRRRRFRRRRRSHRGCRRRWQALSAALARVDDPAQPDRAARHAQAERGAARLDLERAAHQRGGQARA